MPVDYDVIVAGLGAMGSAAAAQLAAKRLRVLGLDKFHPPHSFGSSHGLSRIIREAYFEDPLYVPLVQRAYELWARLERDSSRELLSRTGGLMMGRPDGVLVTGARRSAEVHKLPHQILSAAEIRDKFPAFVPPSEMVAVWEPRAGVLFPELAIQTQLELAAKDGAMLKFNEPLLQWEAFRNGVRVQTSNGVYAADRLVLSSGAWLGSLVPQLHLPLTVERQVLFWFEPRSNPEWFQPTTCPIYICEYQPRRFFYGFPDLGDGVKIGVHHEGGDANPDSLDRTVTETEIDSAHGLLKRFLPHGAGALKSSAVCMYTNTPDEHFILDFHPKAPQVLIISPCSGHGFKFAPVIGEIAASLLTGETPPFDLSLFKVSRFLARGKDGHARQM
jgi:sarcosine oxidase